MISKSAAIWSQRWEGRGLTIDLAMDRHHQSYATLIGRGSVPGTRGFIELLDAALEFSGREARTKALVDLSQLSGSPIRAQVMLGKWMLVHRTQIDRIAIFGAAAWERKLAMAIMKIARIDEVGFYPDEASARAYLQLAAP